MFVVTLLPKVGNLFSVNYEFGAEKYDFYCFLFLFTLNMEGGENILLEMRDFDLKFSLMFKLPLLLAYYIKND